MKIYMICSKTDDKETCHYPCRTVDKALLELAAIMKEPDSQWYITVFEVVE